MSLGLKIRKLRMNKNLTQKDLADQMHVTYQTVSKWEKDENEPDVSTLRELAKYFGCSMDHLLSEEESEEANAEVDEKEPVVVAPATVEKTIIIHEGEMHVCKKCLKDIPADDLAIDVVSSHRSRGRGRTSLSSHDEYYHKECLEEVKKERAMFALKVKNEKASRTKKMSFGWGIAGGVVALVVSLLIMLLVPACQKALHPALAVALSVIIGYAIFAMIYCIISGSYIGEVFMWCACLSIKFPGLIFSWDIDGFIWVIGMKILFAILGFLIGVAALAFAVALSAILGGVSFPFVLIHNIRNDYEDAF